MNIKNLRAFAYIMEEGTLVRASERLNLSQPAVSRLLSLLEEELGVSLFDRRKKRLIPSLAGDQLYPEAVRILASIDGIPDFLNHVQKNRQQPLRIVCHPRLMNGLVLPALTMLAQKRPDIRIHLEFQSRKDVSRYIAQEIFDVGISSLPVPLEKIVPEEIHTTELQVLLPKDHKLADKSYLTVDDLQSYRYIALTEHTLLRKLADNTVLRTGKRLDVFHEVSLSMAAHYFVAEKMGYTITDSVSFDSKLHDSLKLIPFHPKTTIKFGLFRKSEGQQHEAIEEFASCIRTIANSIA